MRTTIQQLVEFLTACRGNWRNACFISCNECKCHSPCSGYLMSADAGGKPVLISAAEYERLTGQRIDPSECRGNLFRSAFEDIYALYLKLTRGLSFTSRRTLDDCIDRLVTRGLVAEGRGSSEYEALYDLLSCLYIAPVSANPFLRLSAFLSSGFGTVCRSLKQFACSHAQNRMQRNGRSCGWQIRRFSAAQN